MHFLQTAQRFFEAARHLSYFRSNKFDSTLQGLPESTAFGDDAPALTPLDSATSLRRRASLRVLLAEDCPVNRQLACALLSRWGIEPVIACDGAEAVRLADAQDFDIILMDVVMPVMDGLSATVEIRRLERENSIRRAVPVVAFTSTAIAYNKALLHRLGINDVLKKPSNVDMMKECLERWCPDDAAALSV
jgi:CheY-like chemotaxis protein